MAARRFRCRGLAAGPGRRARNETQHLVLVGDQASFSSGPRPEQHTQRQAHSAAPRYASASSRGVMRRAPTARSGRAAGSTRRAGGHGRPGRPPQPAPAWLGRCGRTGPAVADDQGPQVPAARQRAGLQPELAWIIVVPDRGARGIGTGLGIDHGVHLGARAVRPGPRTGARVAGWPAVRRGSAPASPGRRPSGSGPVMSQTGQLPRAAP